MRKLTIATLALLAFAATACTRVIEVQVPAELPAATTTTVAPKPTTTTTTTVAARRISRTPTTVATTPTVGWWAEEEYISELSFFLDNDGSAADDAFANALLWDSELQRGALLVGYEVCDNVRVGRGDIDEVVEVYAADAETELELAQNLAFVFAAIDCLCPEFKPNLTRWANS